MSRSHFHPEGSNPTAVRHILTVARYCLMPVRQAVSLCSALLLAAPAVIRAREPAPVEFTVKLETVMKHDDDKFHWFHPRATAMPGMGLRQKQLTGKA